MNRDISVSSNENITVPAAILADTLDLMVLLNKEDRFVAYVMTLCNEIASQFSCSRVSLGYMEGRYIKTQGISHIEKFELKMEAVKSLEAAMEEAFDQDDEIIWPAHSDEWTVNLSHETYSRKYGAENMISLPLRINNIPVAVLSCERFNTPFTLLEIRGLRIMCDQAVRRLFDLKRKDRWFGVRLAGWTRDKLSGLFGVEHTFIKSIGVILSLILIYLFMGKWDYKVQTPCILKTNTLTWLTAPYDGYVSRVNVEVGDIVKEGDSLLGLDTRELILQESSALADLHRFTRTAEKARAENSLADMKIAEARQAQAMAQLNRTRYFLEQAKILAPFSGIVVSGERKDLLGAPVRKGKILFELARLEDYYLRLEVAEEDIHEISTGNQVNISFLSRPKVIFPATVTKIAPMAEVTENGNIFVTRAVFDNPLLPWLRPGMNGIGKIEIEERQIAWILTHRTIDFFRLHRWW